MPGDGVVGEEDGEPVGSERRAEARAGELVAVVADEVPAHRLEPGERVDGRPLLDRVARVLLAEDDVLETHVAGAVRPGDVVVDAVGVGVEVLAGGRRDEGQLLLRDGAPAHGADHLVGGQPGRADHLRETARGHVPAEVHLEEAVLGRDEALGPEQVVGGVGVDLGYAPGVADHLDPAAQPVELDLAAGLRPGLTDDTGDDDRERHDEEDDEDEHAQPDPAGHLRTCHPARLGHPRSTTSQARPSPTQR